MCGRYTNKFYWKNLHRLLELTTPPVQLPLRFNIAPTQNAPIVRHQDAEHGGPRALSALRWGLVPSWAKGLGVGGSMINARAEGIDAKPAFRSAFKRRRCLIPASGIYEWKNLGEKHKRPYYITSSDDEPLALAGLWEFWKPPDGDAVETFTIITTTPNEMMAKLHDRMPVILDKADFERWLDPAFQDVPALLELLKPYPSELMRHWPVSTRVNSPKFDDPSCIERVAEEAPGTAEKADPAPDNPPKLPISKPRNPKTDTQGDLWSGGS